MATTMSKSAPERCPSKNGDLPIPVVEADNDDVPASVSVYGYCQGGHGDGPLIFGDPPVVLAASGEVAVKVRSPFLVRFSWSGEPFASDHDGSYVSPGAPPGCHRLDIEVTDPASDAAGSFSVNVAMQSVC